MSLYQKYRPNKLEQVKGNTEIIKAISNMLLDRESVPHAFLLHGATGCGKTTIARIIAMELNCSGQDYREVDSADFRGIDTIREIRKNSQYLPLEGDCRVWVIDECHKMTNDAQNALLKILEDPPPHVFFILCTTDPQKLISTIRGRCSQFQVNVLNETQMLGLLRKIVRMEAQTLTDEVYDVIIKESNGHPRNAIQILEQVLNVPQEERVQMAKQAVRVQSQAIDLCRALIKKASWAEVKVILEGLKDQEVETIRRVVLGYMSAVLLKSDNQLVGRIMEEFLDPFYDSGFPQLVYACYAVTKN
jgi:DNA polymerase III gamma/tau subunit